MKLGEEIQTRLKHSLEAEIKFYASRGLITKEEQELIAATFNESSFVASKSLPLSLSERPIAFTQEIDETLTDKIEKAVEEVMTKIGIKATYDRSSWSGSASQWKTAEAYCSSCLIDLNTGSGPKTKDRCHLPYKKPGSSAINVNALRAMASGGRGLPALKGIPRSEIVKAANFMIRHWPSAFDKPAPANIYRLAGKTPPEGVKEASVKFLKDKSGQWWMLGIYSNRWMDREKDIISESAHKEFANWVNESGFRPQVTVYHMPKMPEGFWEKVWEKWGDDVGKLNEVVRKVYEKVSLGEVERIVYLNGFSLAVAKIFPHKYEEVEKLSSKKETGMSHGFLAMAESFAGDFSSIKDAVNIIERYRSFEVTVLRRARAANFGTAPLFVEEKGVAYTEEDRAFMADLVPEEILNALDEDTKEASNIMDLLLDHKELSDPVAPSQEKAVDDQTDEEEETEEENMGKETKAKQVESEAPEVQVEDVKETSEREEGSPAPAVVQQVTEKVLETLNPTQLQEVLASIVKNQEELAKEIASLKADRSKVESDLKELKKSDDEKIAAAYSPINWQNVGYAASASDKTEVPADIAEKVLQNVPSTNASLTGDKTIDRFLESVLEGRK